MKTILFLNFLLIGYTTFGQTDSSSTFIGKIRNVVNESNSDFYYPTLLDKVRTQSNSLTKEDIYYLYYGQIVQADHKRLSFMRNPEEGNFMKLVMGKKCKKVITVGYEILDRSPVELTTLLHTNLCLKELGQEDIHYLKNRFNLLLDAILSTGDGLTKETSIKITNVEDDRVIKGILGFLGGSESVSSDNGKAFSVWTKTDGKKLYFEDLWTE